MLIKCKHCLSPCKQSNELIKCSLGKPKSEYACRYRLAKQLHQAVLDRLLDPKNVEKGRFSTDAFVLFNDLLEEVHELKAGLNNLAFYTAYTAGGADGIDENVRKTKENIIDECGDVAAYLAAIIDAVKEDADA